MSGVIYNASAGSCFYDASGSAISAQPTLTGRLAGTGKSNSYFTYVGQGLTDKGFLGSRVWSTKNTGVFSVKLGTNVTGATVAASSGKSKFTKNSHGLSVGDSVYITDTNGILTGIHYILAKDANTFTTQFAYTSGAGTITYKPMSGTFRYGTGVGNRYSVMRKVSTTINNVANTALQTGAAPDAYRQSPHKILTAFRHDGKATAIRSGFWNEFSGTWTTAPTATNSSIGDISGNTVTGGTADHGANVNRSIAGELVYKTAAAVPVMADYNLPTA